MKRGNTRDNGVVLPCHERGPQRHVDLENERQSDWNGRDQDGESIQDNFGCVGIETIVRNSFHEENCNHENEAARDKNLDNHHYLRLEDGNNPYRLILEDTLLSFPDLRVGASIHNLTVALSGDNCRPAQDNVTVFAARVLACKDSFSMQG